MVNLPHCQLTKKKNVKTSEECRSFKKRIESACCAQDFKKLEASLTRLYDVGVFTVSEFKRLDEELFRASHACLDGAGANGV